MRAAIVVGLTLALLGGAARAQPESERVAIVLLTRDARTLAPVLRERLARRRVTTEVTVVADLDRDRLLDAEGADATLVRVAIQIVGDRARIVFAQPHDQRFAIRDVPLARGLDEVGRETVGTVVESAVDSLLAGTRLELTRSELSDALARAPTASRPPEASAALPAPPTTSSFAREGAAPSPPPRQSPPPPPPPRESVAPPPPPRESASRSGRNEPPAAVTATAAPPASSTSLGAAAGYGAVVMAPSALTFMTGPLLAVTATRGRAHAVADVAYLLPTSLDARPLGAQLSAVTPRLGWAYAFRCQRVCASAGARAGADVIWIRPTAASPAATATGSGTLVSPIVGARAALDARLGAVTIGLLLTVDVDLLGVRLVAEGAASQPVATAWRARPGLALTAGWR